MELTTIGREGGLGRKDDRIDDCPESSYRRVAPARSEDKSVKCKSEKPRQSEVQLVPLKVHLNPF